MTKKNASNLIPFIVLISMGLFFIGTFVRGNFLVKKSEKELNSTKQIEEAQAKKYSLKEIDAKTGQIRWELTAKEGETENNLQGAVIKDIKAEVYKNNQVVFELDAPYAKANASDKKIYLYGDVTAMDKEGDFFLQGNQVLLGMGTSIEAQKGFKVIFKKGGGGKISGDSAIINDDQTRITVKNLKEATFKDLSLTGNEVYLEKEKNSDLTNVIISNGGKVILRNQKNDTLSANIIKWDKTGQVEAIDNVIYNSENKIFKAGYLLLKPDKKLYAKNDVLIIHGDTTCYGNSLSFENNSTIVLNGRPKAIQGKKQILADKIVYDINTRKVEAIGNVRTIVKAEKQNKV